MDWRSMVNHYGDQHVLALYVTANPILFASSLYDTVTPLRSATRMHAVFPGSGMLITNAERHTNRSDPGLCNILRRQSDGISGRANCAMRACDAVLTLDYFWVRKDLITSI